MTNPIHSIRAVLFTAAISILVAAAPALRAESTAAERATWTKASGNKIYAQKLVNETMAAYPELLVIGMHGIAPGATGPHMLASNLDRIGKNDDDDDIGVSTEHKTVCAPNQKDPSQFEVLMPMKDATGKTLNAAIGLVFRYKAGDDELKMHARAIEIRDHIARQTPTFEALFEPAR